LAAFPVLRVSGAGGPDLVQQRVDRGVVNLFGTSQPGCGKWRASSWSALSHAQALASVTSRQAVCA
jgi:hypothetical protein